MANTTWTSNMVGAADLSFRLWAKGISDALGAVGMVRVDYSANAGAWGSVMAAPVYTNSPNTELAWEVWAFPPSTMQTTTSPLFIRVGYGIHASVGFPRLQIKLATTQGTGGVMTGIGGNVSTTVNTNAGTGELAQSPDNCWASCDGHGLAMAFNITGTNGVYRHWLVIDRFRDPANGDPLATGVAMYYGYSGAAGTTTVTYDMVQDEFASYSFYAPCITPGLSPYLSNLNANGEVVLYPWRTVSRQGHGVSKMIATHAVADIVSFRTQSVKWLTEQGSGTTRTVRSLGTWVTGYFDIQTYSLGPAIALWWSD